MENVVTQPSSMILERLRKCSAEHKDEIFQEAFITLWEKIMNKKIYVEDGELKGKDGDAFSGKLTTFFMSIARLKYLEWARENLHQYTDEEEERRRRADRAFRSQASASEEELQDRGGQRSPRQKREVRTGTV